MPKNEKSTESDSGAMYLRPGDARVAALVNTDNLIQVAISHAPNSVIQCIATAFHRGSLFTPIGKVLQFCLALHNNYFMT